MSQTRNGIFRISNRLVKKRRHIFCFKKRLTRLPLTLLAFQIQSRSEEQTEIKVSFINWSHPKTTSFEFLIIKNQRILRRVYQQHRSRDDCVTACMYVLVYALSDQPMCRPYFTTCLDRPCYKIYYMFSLSIKKFIIHDIWAHTWNYWRKRAIFFPSFLLWWQTEMRNKRNAKYVPARDA